MTTGGVSEARSGSGAGGGLGAGGRRAAVVRLRREARVGLLPVRVIVLHGLAGSASVWHAYEQHALERVELWEGTLPWSAEGDPDWSLRDDPSDHVERALDAVPGGVDVLVAHSFTAGPALEAIARRGSRAPRAAVVVAPFHRRSPADFSWDDATYYLGGFHRILEEGLRISAGDRLSPQLRAAMALRVRDRIGPYGWQQFFGAYLRSPFLDVAALRLPVLVVAGAQDFAAPPEDAVALAAALPGGRLRLFDDCGHFAMAEQPRRFADAVHALLSEVFPEPSESPAHAGSPGHRAPSGRPADRAPSDVSLLPIPTPTHRS
ncbi:pimeloyl-ACP methyl ester carboxylesterase [Streptomyces umbrinus]|uniref:Pimeloyl-ACP methyl ester carboxylesterase n=1 Tax=Streptomyces umbrinus TaxID=67370 RepID=A0ABU0STT0_9ACTN|nr:pimeloyl-ACP methyl ester carboxylesterase [Streptomyces umbrinus]